jgi:VWFA-related protein
MAAVLQPRPFRVSARLVQTPVTVTEEDGRKVAGLEASDFVLTDAGRHREFTMDADLAPLSLVVAVQTGADCGPALEKIRKMGSTVEALLSGHDGELALLAYDTEVRLLAPLSADTVEFHKALAGMRARAQGGRLHDAVAEAALLLAAGDARRRRALLILGEAKDHGSESTLLRAAELAQSHNIQVHPLTYSRVATAFTTREQAGSGSGGFDILAGLRELSRLGSANSAAELARLTGGLAESFTRQSGLERALSRMSDELHQQYVLSFVPAEATAGEFREIRVEVPTRPRAAVRHRPGYWIT